MSRGIPSPLAAIKLRQIARRIEPDIVHAWLYHGNICSLALRDICQNILWSIHNTNLSREKSKRMTRLINRACATLSSHIPRHVVYASTQARTVHEELGYDRRKGILISNGVDLEKFQFNPQARQRIRSSLGLQTDEAAVGCIARFDPQKDHQTVIRSFAKVIAKKNARLVLAGTGCDTNNEHLQAWLNREGLQANALLLGERRDIADLLCALDVLVIGSAYGEAMPVIALEAAAVGLPIVTTNVGDVAPFTLEPTDIVAPRQPDQMAASILRILERINTQTFSDLKAARHKMLKSYYGISEMVQKYYNLYVA